VELVPSDAVVASPFARAIAVFSLSMISAQSFFNASTLFDGYGCA